MWDCISVCTVNGPVCVIVVTRLNIFLLSFFSCVSLCIDVLIYVVFITHSCISTCIGNGPCLREPFVCVCVCSRGLEAAQSPGRTEWIYKLMEFKACSIDYHYNKQPSPECLIIFRQRFCALSSNSADAVTLADICL